MLALLSIPIAGIVLWAARGAPPAGEGGEAPLSLEESLVVAMDPDAERVVIDCGTLAIGEVAERRFEVTNATDSPVAIQRIESFCGCARLDWDREPIGPSAVGEVRLLLDSLRFPPGVFEKQSVIHFRDRAAPAVPIAIRGRAERLIEIEPEFPELAPLVGESVRLEVSPRVRAPGWELLATRAEHGRFEIFAPPELASSAPIVLAATGSEPRRWSDHLLITARDANGAERTVRFPIRVEHRSRIECSPGSRVIFGSRGRGEGPAPKQVVLAAAREDLAFQILGLQFARGTGIFAAQLEETKPGREYRIDLTLGDPPKEGVVRDTLVVSTDDPLCPSIELEVVAVGSRPLADAGPAPSER